MWVMGRCWAPMVFGVGVSGGGWLVWKTQREQVVCVQALQPRLGPTVPQGCVFLMSSRLQGLVTSPPSRGLWPGIGRKTQEWGPYLQPTSTGQQRHLPADLGGPGCRRLQRLPAAGSGLSGCAGAGEGPVAGGLREAVSDAGAGEGARRRQGEPATGCSHPHAAASSPVLRSQPLTLSAGTPLSPR